MEYQELEINICKRDFKRNWNFDGFVVSDWGSIKEMISHGYAKDYKQAAELAKMQVQIWIWNLCIHRTFNYVS
jgi:beta-glucosidase-like glycosyl hydrolase